ncbi:MAG: PKD domain-containing protein, partial [Bacteroidales bacterium]|nr:PKD domain-containing protein [Bacteroidales bacterium]
MKKILGMLILTLICCINLTADLADSLVAYYPFNGNANDESGNGNHGTVNGATLTTNRFGNENSTYDFDGVNDYISTLLTFPDNQNISISVWVNWDSFQSSYREIWSFWDISIFPINSRVFLGPLESYFRFGDGWNNINYQLPVGQWIHLTGIIDGNNRYFYVNGSLYSSQTDVISPKYNNFVIGRQGSFNGEYLEGIIDDIYIYNRVLSESEIQELYFHSNFMSSTTNACAGETILFTDISTSTDSIISWEWDFENDGIYDSTEQNPTHIYHSEGTYSVKLKVSNGTFVDSLVKENLITVEYVPLAEPQNVQINIVYPDAIISWSAVDTTVYGDSINVDAYLVYYCGSPDSIYYFHGLTVDTTYTHQYVAQFSNNMFYQVTSYIGELRLLQSVIAENPNFKLGELDLLIE